MNEQDLLAYESSRCDIYKALAKCFLFPEEGLIDIASELEAQLSLLDSQATPSAKLLYKNLRNTEDLNQLQIEYARLYVGPYSLLAPPYGSVYLDNERRVMGQSTVNAVQFYKEAGLEVASTYKEAPDHITTELEFMYFLIYGEIQAYETGATQRFLDNLSMQKRFLFCHLNRWAQAFALTIKKNTHTDFYVNLADILEVFVNEDVQYLGRLESLEAVDA